ncbi:DnaJ domain-containing protein [Nostoc sp. CENA67]|uniref:DnaJ domain-containing protein n=1 Tax=Amazonocrinis nigriterrae CENA67 TaxID=2794033 RepID=A0A8J7I0R4_9NOST|nr:DnaJ domain-containing protein [Amazonocrinis nigriterrae]MBH8565899.1 DnaJ domain-containing protein [Amazonocrinis nigriterrae CENA67]
MNDISAYPLTWATIYPRTHKREAAQFQVSFSVARDDLLNELRLLGAKNVIISSNVPLRKDGLPYANFKEPDDTGVAVYFSLKDKSYALCCDRWLKTKDNMRAIGLHIAAMRGMERWGVGSVEQAFAGYQALPPSIEKKWWQILGVDVRASDDEVKAAYRELARKYHPDGGNSPDSEKMTEINAAYEEAKQAGYKCGHYNW